MQRRFYTFAFFAFIFQCLSPSAHAQGPNAAEILFREGRKASASGDWDTACSKFTESQRIEPAPGTLLNVAECEEKTGHLLAARSHFLEAAASYAASDRRGAFAMQRGHSIEPRIPRLVIYLSPNAPEGIGVYRDGALLNASAFGVPVMVDPAEVTVQVRARGRVERRYTLAMKERQTVELHVEAGETEPPLSNHPAVVSLAPVSPGAESTSHTRRTVGWAFLGVGAVALGAGAVTGILALDRANTVKSHCDAQYACDSEGVDAGSSAKTLGWVSTGALITGVVGVALGSYFILSSNEKSRTTQVIPAVGVHGGGISLSRAF